MKRVYRFFWNWAVKKLKTVNTRPSIKAEKLYDDLQKGSRLFHLSENSVSFHLIWWLFSYVFSTKAKFGLQQCTLSMERFNLESCQWLTKLVISFYNLVDFNRSYQFWPWKNRIECEIFLKITGFVRDINFGISKNYNYFLFESSGIKQAKFDWKCKLLFAS